MGIGVSVFLIAVGAILAFAVTGSQSIADVIDINVVGYILIGAGLLGLAFTLYLSQRTTTGVAREREAPRDRDVPPRDVY